MKNIILAAVEVREAGDTPGRLYGVLLTYGERATDRAEVFEPGSLTWPDGGIVLNRQHERKAPVLRFGPVVAGNAVTIDAAIPDTTAGRDAAEEIRSGLFTGLSIEFRAIRETFTGGVRRIQAAALTAAAMVDAGSYQTALEVRAAEVQARAAVPAGRRRVWL